MQVQTRIDVDNTPLIIGGNPKAKESEVVAQDAGHTSDLVYGTLMSYNPTSQKWTPFANEAATNGTQIPTGIILAKVLEADIVAGDVENIPILVGDAVINKDLLTIENAKLLTTIINVPTNLNKTVEEVLRWIGIFMSDVVDATSFEN